MDAWNPMWEKRGLNMPEGIVEQLRDLADMQDLAGRAIEAMTSHWRDADAEAPGWAFTLEEIQPVLGAQMLCFRSGWRNVEAPYIATNLQLFVFGYHVGWHELLTDLGGQVIREDGSIAHEYFADGRAAILIERARGRTEEDPQEWIGLVGLMTTPANRLLPEWALGGYTTTLALATGLEDYRERVAEYFGEFGVVVEELDDVEPLSHRLGKVQPVDDEILDLAGALSPSEPVLHSNAIYSYVSQDEDDS